MRDQTALAHGDFDMIICSDVLYDPAEWEAHRKSLDELGGSDGSVAYLAHRTRNIQEGQFFAGLGKENSHGKSFRARRLLGEGEERVLGWRRGPEKEGGRDQAEGVMWGRRCFPDVALYELSPVFANSKK